jgi:hypothetical protein
VQYFFLTAEVALMNGLIGETDSLLKSVLATMDESFDTKKAEANCDIILNFLGFLVLVPSNPETSYFQLVEGILNLLKDHEWGNSGYILKARILCGIIGYLSAQS